MNSARRAFEPRVLTLRDADLGDATRLFAWANDPDTRRASLSTAPIAWDDHVEWLRRRLHDAAAVTLIAEELSQPVGQIRFDRLDDSRARVSVVIAPEARGQGLARRLIAAGVERIFAEGHARTIVAEVRVSNRRSLVAFGAAGFVECGSVAAGDGERVAVLEHTDGRPAPEREPARSFSPR